MGEWLEEADGVRGIFIGTFPGGPTTVVRLVLARTQGESRALERPLVPWPACPAGPEQPFSVLPELP